MQKRRQRDHKSQKWWMNSRKECFPYKIELVVIRIHRDYDRMHKTCTDSSQTVYQHLEWEEGLGSTSNQEAICIWYLITKVETVFCDVVSLGLSNNSKLSIMPKNGWPKMNSLFFIYAFCGYFVWFYFLFPFLSYWSFCFLGACCERQKKRTWRWVIGK